MAIIFRLLRYPRARALAAWMSELVPSSKPLLMRLACQEMIPSQCSSTDLTKCFNGSKHRLSNGLVESTNTKVRLLTRMAFGFKSPEAMIALAMLNLGGYCPPLPGRRAAA